MLPYPSGDLHIGHWYAMTPSDARARFMRMNGYNVLFPMGFDAFGLPAENAAIKHNIHPKKWTYANIERMRKQLRSMGAMFDWRREAVSADPEYYRWTQWFFIQLFKHGLAYRKMSPVDWCPNCNTTLAREQVWGDDRHCERCGTPVIKKNLEQWFFRTTQYADELLNYDDHRLARAGARPADQLDRPIRRRGGVLHHRARRPAGGLHHPPRYAVGRDLHGAGPRASAGGKADHARAESGGGRLHGRRPRARPISQREAADKEKTGVFTGGYAINPVNGKRIPIWIADYVLMTYGTGAIMAVPAHDERDFAFALKFGLPIIPVIDRPDGVSKSLVFPGSVKEGFADALKAAGIEFYAAAGRRPGRRPVCHPAAASRCSRYIELMQRYLQPGNWNEIVGGRWAFVFSRRRQRAGFGRGRPGDPGADARRSTRRSAPTAP